MENDLDNTPPQSLENEMCYLGSVIVCEDKARQKLLRGMLTRLDFFSQDHAAIFDSIAELIDAGKPLDAHILANELQDKGVLDQVGGYPYLGRIFDTVPSHHHGEHYGRIVQDKSARRHAITRAESLAARLRLPADDEQAEQIIQRAIGDLWRVSMRRSRVQVFTGADMMRRWVEKRMEKTAPAMLTGIPDIDAYPGVFGFGKYTIVAGRPSMGKSTYLRWLLGMWADAGTPIGLVACEEDENKIAGNYIAAESGLENDAVAYKTLGESDWTKIHAAAGRISKRPWFGVDTAFTLNEVATAVELLATQHGCKIIGVDHLHLIRYDQGTETEQREIKEVSRRLKELAKQHKVVLIAAAQLSRPAEKVKVPQAPTLTDLRASGAIEEHADAVMLLHREDYYRPREAATKECQVIVAKNRNGRRGMLTLIAELEHQRFKVAPDPFGVSAPRVPYANHEPEEESIGYSL